jgi:hypothetical protein
LPNNGPATHDRATFLSPRWTSGEINLNTEKNSENASPMKMKFVNNGWSTAAVAAVAVLLMSFTATNTASAHFICVTKFCDSNGDGVQDPGEPLIGGWPYTIARADDNSVVFSGVTDENGPTCTKVDPGDYVVTEGTPSQTNWVHTTPTQVHVTVEDGETVNVSFGNVCIGSCGGARTKGFWANKNGQNLETSSDLSFLCTLCLRNESGSFFCPTSKEALSDFLLGANAKNMANQLSAQLAAMELNVRHLISGDRLVFAPCLTNFGFSSPFITINDLMTAANDALCANGQTFAGSPDRAYQECLKNALDRANNNKNCVNPNCDCPFSFDP